MKASEYIEMLRDLITAYGDLECVDSNGCLIGEPEYYVDEDERTFVLALEGDV